MRSAKIVLTCAALLLVVATAPTVFAQKSGQSATIKVGTVVSTERVNLQSDAAKTAVLGGVIGYHATSNSKSKSRKRKNAALGAAALGGATRVGEGDLTGTLYVVKLQDGSEMRVVSDQNQVVPGDCVTVEQVRDNANIRRADPVLCEPETRQVMGDLEPELEEEAEECYAAKQELLNAETDEQASLATRKVSVLCNT
jgi:membrane protein implicated in regulation of membrane protease activity